ncbi:hypothetical protein MKW98_020599, partial [Papaver atlanticum]
VSLIVCYLCFSKGLLTISITLILEFPDQVEVRGVAQDTKDNNRIDHNNRRQSS